MEPFFQCNCVTCEDIHSGLVSAHVMCSGLSLVRGLSTTVDLFCFDLGLLILSTFTLFSSELDRSVEGRLQFSLVTVCVRCGDSETHTCTSSVSAYAVSVESSFCGTLLDTVCVVYEVRGTLVYSTGVLSV